MATTEWNITATARADSSSELFDVLELLPKSMAAQSDERIRSFAAFTLTPLPGKGGRPTVFSMERGDDSNGND